MLVSITSLIANIAFFGRGWVGGSFPLHFK